MKVAICCATKYQTLNAINLAYNTFPHEWEIDLYIKSYSAEVRKIAERIRKYKIFDNVYEYNIRVNKPKSVKHYYDVLVEAILPRKFVESSLSELLDISKKQYDYISITCGQSSFEVALIRAFSSAETFVLEEGTASYVGDIVHEFDRKRVWRILGRRLDKIHPQTIYVNNLSFCDSIAAPEKQELLPLNKCGEAYLKMILDIFDYKDNDMYSFKTMIYLTQPMNEIDPLLIKQVNDVHKVIKQYADKGIIRIHHHDKETYDLGLIKDDTNNMWELTCFNCIEEKHVLIAIGSTAQITPKLLFDKEPWLIFLYNIFQYSGRGYSTIKYNNYDATAKKIREQYSDKSKVVIPKSINELRQVLEKILDK